MHYDATLADRYRSLNRQQRDLLWAADVLIGGGGPAAPPGPMLHSPQVRGQLHALWVPGCNPRLG